MKGCAGSGLIGPWPRPGGGSCQSATLVCQPKFGSAKWGIASFRVGSATAAGMSAVAAIEATKIPPANMTARAARGSFRLAKPGIMISLKIGLLGRSDAHYVFLEETALRGVSRGYTRRSAMRPAAILLGAIFIGTPLSPNVRLRIWKIGFARLRKLDRFVRTARNSQS